MIIDESKNGTGDSGMRPVLGVTEAVVSNAQGCKARVKAPHAPHGHLSIGDRM